MIDHYEATLFATLATVLAAKGHKKYCRFFNYGYKTQPSWAEELSKLPISVLLKKWEAYRPLPILGKVKEIGNDTSRKKNG